MLRRAPGMVLAVAAHLALVVTVRYLFPFLQGFTPPSSTYDSPYWWLIDSLLVLQFGVPHSLLLTPFMRDRLERVLPCALHGCLFCLTTCLSLLLLIFAWQRTPVVVWQLEGWAAWPACVAYFLSWAGLFYSLSLTGYGWQTGWTPFWAWFRGLPAPPRPSPVSTLSQGGEKTKDHGAYRWLRHPVYLAFLGQIWMTPMATLDRVLMMALLTVYVAVGSCLKDQRLLFYLGDRYRSYQARVPGYPVVGFGALGRIHWRGERAALTSSRVCPQSAETSG
jgi:protein-S-isoprenylcysteine O-methyltransferase Ste14